MEPLPTYLANENIKTGSISPQANADELNPFNERSAGMLSQGFEHLANTADKYDEKLDAMWAQNNAIKNQATWRKSVQSYTDPDAFQQDFTTAQKDQMGSAPSGRASDMYVHAMGQFGNHMLTHVVYNKIHADKLAAAQELRESNERLDQDAYEMGMAVKEARAAAKNTEKTAQGIVPQALIDSIHADTNTALDRTEAAVVAKTAGGNTAADQLQNGTLGKNLTPEETNSLANQYRLQGETDLYTAQVQGQKDFADQLTKIKSGLVFTNDKQDEALARMRASSQPGDPKGEKTLGNQAKFYQEIVDAKQEGKMRSDMFTMTAGDRDAYLNQLQSTKGVESKEFKTASNISKQFQQQIEKDPLQFAFNSANYSKQYNQAVSDMQEAQKSGDQNQIGDAQLKMSNVLTAGMMIQRRSGVPENELAVMTLPEAQQTSANIMKGGVEGASKAFVALKQQYGENFDKAMAQLQRMPSGQGIPAHYAMIEEHMDNPIVHDSLVQAMQAENPPKGTLSLSAQFESLGGDKKKLDKAINEISLPFRDALSVTDPGVKQANQVPKVVASYAKSLMLSNPNLKEEEAAHQAWSATVASKYNTEVNLNGRTLLLPATDSQGNGINAGNVKANLESITYDIATGRHSQMPDVAAYHGKLEASDDMKREFAASVMKDGQWIMSPDKKNLQLVMNIKDALIPGLPSTGMNYMDNNSGKGIRYVYGTDGNPIKVPVDSLNTGWWDTHVRTASYVLKEDKDQAKWLAETGLHTANAVAKTEANAFDYVVDAATKHTMPVGVVP